MKRQKLQTALKKLNYSDDSIKSILSGRMLPSMSKAIVLKTSHKIPLNVWLDVKAYLDGTPQDGDNAISKAV